MNGEKGQICESCYNRLLLKSILEGVGGGCPGYKPTTPSPPPTKKSSYEDFMKNDPDALELI
jgi:hypothetical protein